MKKLKLIYNPFSGDRSFKSGLDGYVAAFQRAGYEAHLFRSVIAGDIATHIATMPAGFYDALAVAGGDGTLNMAVGAMINHGIDAPLLALPAGTANDFASFIGMPKNAEDCAAVLRGGEIVRTDVGHVGDRYFINVCAAGLFTHVSQQVESGLKTALGKPAYYLKSLEEIPNFEPISVRITNSTTTMDEDIFLFLVLNTAGAGGFDRLVPDASITDGKLDFIALRACPILDLGRLLIRVIQQRHLTDPRVIYFQDDFVKVELLQKSDKYDSCDIDGEWGPKLPVTIRNLSGKLPLFVPTK